MVGWAAGSGEGGGSAGVVRGRSAGAGAPLTGPGTARAADGHVHSEWSWDAVAGSMERSCARAVELGLPSIAFTEHAEFTVSYVSPEVRAGMPDHLGSRVTADGTTSTPALDVPAYLDCVRRCRDRFPGLRIRSGVELSEPHWHPAEVAGLLGSADFDQVLGSVHALRYDGQALGSAELYARLPRERVVRDYLAEVLRLVGSTAGFAVLAHVDYPARYWPGGMPADGPVGWPGGFADELREVLRVLAASGRALEVNTRLPLSAEVIGWWWEAGGAAVSFGSDAHVPDGVGHGFAEATAVAEARGFSPAADPTGFWTRRRVL